MNEAEIKKAKVWQDPSNIWQNAQPPIANPDADRAAEKASDAAWERFENPLGLVQKEGEVAVTHTVTSTLVADQKPASGVFINVPVAEGIAAPTMAPSPSAHDGQPVG